MNLEALLITFLAFLSGFLFVEASYHMDWILAAERKEGLENLAAEGAPATA